MRIMTYLNAYNTRRVRSDNKVGQSGVYYHAKKGRYHATITIHTRRIHLGWYVSRATAIRARQNAERMFEGFIQ